MNTSNTDCSRMMLIFAPTISAACLMTSIHDDIDTEINNIDDEFHNVDDHY